MLIVDETADEKSSADCAGAARKYSGTLGGVALCQVAVTLTYATSRGHALINSGRSALIGMACAAAGCRTSVPRSRMLMVVKEQRHGADRIPVVHGTIRRRVAAEAYDGVHPVPRAPASWHPRTYSAGRVWVVLPGLASPILTERGRRVGSLGPGLACESADARPGCPANRSAGRGPGFFWHPPAVPA